MPQQRFPAGLGIGKGREMAASQGKDAQRFRYQNRRLEHMPGMSLLLDAFALVDYDVAQSIAIRGEQPACGPGCHHCCTQPIPLTPLEVLAVRLFVEQELPLMERDALKAAFAPFCGDRAILGATCPFLREKRCAVYPVRPIACRRYIVYGAPCGKGEDPTQTRHADVLQPRQEVMQAALRLTLPWYGERYSLPGRLSTEAAQAFFRGVTTVLQAVPWATYA